MFISSLIPIPKPLKSQSTVFDLKERLEWGEPALTIIDVRSRDAFNTKRISGALSIPMTELVGRTSASLEMERDIYVYGDNDEHTAEAAAQLRDAGFSNVAEIIGGLPAWQAVKGPIEGPLALAA